MGTPVVQPENVVRSTCGCFWLVVGVKPQHALVTPLHQCDRHYGTYLGSDPWCISHGSYEICDPLVAALLREA